MDQGSVFHQEWLRSLREQYKHVARSGDTVTLPSLTEVMQGVGFGEDELRQLKIEATMRADELPQGFQPDLDILSQPEPTPDQDEDEQPAAAEAPEPTVYPAVDMSALDDESESLTFEDSLARDAHASDAEPDDDPIDEQADDPDDPQQISLF